MGVGPVPAIENLLKVTKLSLNDIDLIEVSLIRICNDFWLYFSSSLQSLEAVTLPVLFLMMRWKPPPPRGPGYGGFLPH